MKLQQYDASGSSLPSTGLSACVLGLVLCPFAYIVFGALAGFSPEFSFLALPPLLASAGYLLYRFLSTTVQGSSSHWLAFAEIVSWILIAAFLVIISDFTLLTEFERIGLFSTLFLVSTLIALPVALVRKTALGERLRRLPNAVTMLLLLTVLLAVVAIMVVYLLREPVFL